MNALNSLLWEDSSFSIHCPGRFSSHILFSSPREDYRLLISLLAKLLLWLSFSNLWECLIFSPSSSVDWCLSPGFNLKVHILVVDFFHVHPGNHHLLLHHEHLICFANIIIIIIVCKFFLTQDRVCRVSIQKNDFEHDLLFTCFTLKSKECFLLNDFQKW